MQENAQIRPTALVKTARKNFIHLYITLDQGSMYFIIVILRKPDVFVVLRISGCLPFTKKIRKFRLECKWKD